jgi:hypothetical protein
MNHLEREKLEPASTSLDEMPMPPTRWQYTQKPDFPFTTIFHNYKFMGSKTNA